VLTIIAVVGKESLRDDYTQDSKLGFVVNAIYTMAHALDSMYRDICGAKSPGFCDAMKPVNGSIFIRYLVNASFISYSGDYISFDAAGDPPARWTFTTAASTFGDSLLLAYCLSRLLRVDIIKPVSMSVRPSVRPPVSPQKVFRFE